MKWVIISIFLVLGIGFIYTIAYENGDTKTEDGNGKTME